ncbi:hypothetical protein Tco_0357577 [Tanacetum coccineum]
MAAAFKCRFTDCLDQEDIHNGDHRLLARSANPVSHSVRLLNHISITTISDQTSSEGYGYAKESLCTALLSISRSCTNLPTTTFELLQTPGTRQKIPHQGNQRTMTVAGARETVGNR